MKLLKNKIESADTLVPSYQFGWESVNMFNKHPNEKWKCDDLGESTIEINMPAYSNCVFISNTNATSAKYLVEKSLTKFTFTQEHGLEVGGKFSAVSDDLTVLGVFYVHEVIDDFIFLIIDPLEDIEGTKISYTKKVLQNSGEWVDETISIAWQSVEDAPDQIIIAERTADLIKSDYYTYYSEDNQSELTQLWLEYPPKAFAHIVKISLTPPGGVKLHIGILRGGFSQGFNYASDGFAKSFKDYSQSKERASGASYYKRIGIARVADGKVSLFNSEEVDNFTDICVSSLVEPIAWNFLDHDDGELIYGKVTKIPKAVYRGLNIRELSFNVLEAL